MLFDSTNNRYKCKCGSGEKCTSLELLLTKNSFKDDTEPITLCEIEPVGIKVEKSGVQYTWQSETYLTTGIHYSSAANRGPPLQKGEFTILTVM